MDLDKNVPQQIDSPKAQVADFPLSPGVYLMKSAEGRIIYVGKAKNLKKRVTSYFNTGRDIKTRHLVRRIASLEYIITTSEFDAFILENTLIKQHQPKYNINLKDGKTYPVIRITKEDYPRIFKTRKIIEDGSTYLGPFANVHILDRTMKLIYEMFPIRKCFGTLKKRTSPCLYYHMGQCKGPCAGLTTKEEYASMIEEIKDILEGRSHDLIHKLTEQMNAHASALEFEAASRIRDKIRAIAAVSDANKVVDFEPESRDFVAWIFEGSRGVFTVLQMRGGKLVAKDLFHVRHAGEVSEAIPIFLAQYYDRSPSRPEKILLCDPESILATQTLLGGKYTPELSFQTPANPREQSVINMALENAKMDLIRRLNQDKKKEALVELKKILGLAALPRRIEGFDIAHLGGQMTVASMVSFLFGRPDKAEYRHFHVKTLGGKIDDFESMREITARRYTRLINEKLPLPDLILIDGGIGQLNAVTEVLEALGIKNLPIASLAKKEEEIYLPGKSEPLVLDRRSGALKILQAVRDESHRFATKFNKSLRKNKLAFEVLEKVDGIGAKTSEALMKEYKSLEAVASAPDEDLKKKFRIKASAIAGLKEALQQFLQRKK